MNANLKELLNSEDQMFSSQNPKREENLDEMKRQINKSLSESLFVQINMSLRENLLNQVSQPFQESING